MTDHLRNEITIESKDDDEDGTRAELPPAFETFMVTD